MTAALPPIRPQTRYPYDDESCMNRHWWHMEYMAALPCRCSFYRCQFCEARTALAELRNALGEE